MTGSIDAGFADPVHDAQACFRALLDAMAHPGRVFQVTGTVPPAPLGIAAGAALLTLVDHETPLWLDQRAAPAQAWIAFHCGAPAAAADKSAFALTIGSLDLSRFSPGTHEEPESSTTVICQVDSLGTGRSYRLSGPGLREPEALMVAGLPPDFASIWRRNRALFPRGADLILCAGDRLTALPRTVAVEEI